MTRYVIALLFTAFSGFVTAGNLVLEGRYQQRNVFVINPVSDDGLGYCIYEVTVNGLVTSDEVNSQAFEIDLTLFNLREGDPVVVVLKHKDGCTPRILNPGALEPAPAFECSKIECSAQGLLTWETTGEMGKLPFAVQQFKWNKWVNVGEVMGNGTNGKNAYKFQVSLTSGLNKFRVSQKSYDGEIRKSGIAEVVSNAVPVTYKYDKKLNVIQFSAENAYELYNSFGQVVKRGTGSSLELATLPKGEYYLSYDNKTEKFIRK
ncbi:MAG: hypothetical protein ACK500_07670 [Flavobacteriales bacterium]|jgi:hypothetical protein